MKSLWIILSTLAIANLLAMGGFVGWLVASKRLDAERLRAVREVLVTPIPEAAAAAAAKEAEAAAAATKEAEEKRRQGTPQSAEAAIAADRAKADLQTQTIARLREEMRQLQGQLAREREALDARHAELDAREKRLEAKVAEVARTAGSEQFRQALATLEAQKPPAAKQMLQAMMQGGEAQREQAVAYLAAMEERGRNRVIAEFGKEDPRLAAELLEALRTRGIEQIPPAQASP